jgi:hypothetical protein
MLLRWMTKTIRQMIIHHASGLHESVTDGWADKSEPLFL